MFLDVLFQIWRRLSARLQWWFLWLFSPKFMVSVAGVVLDGSDRVLLQRHRHWVPDVWGLPGGIVQAGETLEKAFSREILEETGLEIAEISLIRIVAGYRLRLEAYFQARLARTETPQVIRIQKKEVAEARFFALDELPLNILPLQRTAIEIARSAVLGVN